jgi:hypothetical protein
MILTAMKYLLLAFIVMIAPLVILATVVMPQLDNLKTTYSRFDEITQRVVSQR